MLDRIKNRIIRTNRSFFYSINCENILYAKKQSQAIVMYHGVFSGNDTRFNGRFMPIADFKTQLNYFKKNFEILPVKELFENKTNRSNKKQIAITFDDGYKNNFDYALPLLEELKIPASFYITGLNPHQIQAIWSDVVDIYSYFVKKFKFQNLIFEKEPNRKRLYCKEINQDINHYTGFLSQEDKIKLMEELEIAAGFKLSDKKDLSQFHLLMSDAEIKETALSKYVTIGSHGTFHSHMGFIPLEQALNELKYSKTYLENCIGKQIDEIAYPSGSYTKDLIEAAYQLGYHYQLAVDYQYEGDKANNKIMDRIGLYNDRTVVEQLHLVNQQLSKS